MDHVSKRCLSTVQRLAFGVAFVIFCSPWAVGADQIYWTDGGSIFRANFDGTGRQTVGSGIHVNGIFVDESRAKLYWTINTVETKIQWRNMNAPAVERSSAIQKTLRWSQPI